MITDPWLNDFNCSCVGKLSTVGVFKILQEECISFFGWYHFHACFRKRKLEKLKKTAEERFKTDEPDVKLVDVGGVKSEGIVNCLFF